MLNKTLIVFLTKAFLHNFSFIREGRDLIKTKKKKTKTSLLLLLFYKGRIGIQLKQKKN